MAWWRANVDTSSTTSGMSRAPAWHAMAAVAVWLWWQWLASMGGRRRPRQGRGRMGARRRARVRRSRGGGKAGGGNVQGGREWWLAGVRGEGCVMAWQGVCDRHGGGSVIGGGWSARGQYLGWPCEVRQAPDEPGLGGPAGSAVCCAGAWRRAAQRQGRVNTRPLRANLMSRGP